MQKKVWLNGKIISLNEARFPLLTHSLHYGSAVFEGIRCYNTKKGPAVFRLADHVKRFFHSARIMGMEMPYNQREIIKAIKKTVVINKLKECYIRPIAFYGEKMGLLPAGAPLYIAVAVWEWGKYLKKDAVSVKISSFMRLHPKSSSMGAKISGHYYNSIIASLEAKKNGFDEALLLDWRGNIAEGPGENIFFVKGKKIITPKDEAILPGITRDSVKKIARDCQFEVIERNIKPNEIKKFDEAFFVGTAVEVNAIGRIGKVKFGRGGEGNNVKIIKEAYMKVVSGQNPKYRSWLDPVK